MRVVGTVLRNSRQICTGLVQHSLRVQGTSYAAVSQSTRFAILNRAYSTDPPKSPKEELAKSEAVKNETSNTEAVKDEKPKSEAAKSDNVKTESAQGEKPKEEKPKDSERFPSRTFGGKSETKERLFPETGPLSLPGIGIFLTTAIGLFVYFNYEKERVGRERKEKMSRVETVGKADVGGRFELVDQDHQTFTEKNMLGKFHVVYFGFCHCPDICPEEMDKIGDALDLLDKNADTKDTVQPVFISCDPQRDTPVEVKSYLKQFHPKFIGLTGTVEQVRTTCKAYRVYFSKPPKVVGDQDYLVDHAIYTYLMDPDGIFVEVYGKDKNAQYMADDIAKRIKKFKDTGRAL
ncbi:Cu-binding protein [Coemansia sp. RSA 2131]|nr:Cu-binding protein [Coemansia sp. RSA 2131]